MRTHIVTLASALVVLANAGSLAAQDLAASAALFSPEATRRAVLAVERHVGGQIPASPMADWSPVRRLAPGTTVQLQVGTQPSASVQIFKADNDGLTVLRLAPSVSSKDARRLREHVFANPESVLGLAAGRGMTAEHVRVSPDGIFVDGRRLGDANQVFERVPRDSVVEILQRTTTNGSTLGATLGTLGGFFLGSVLAAANGFNGGPRAVSWLAFFGTPITLGALGYRSGGGTETIVIYRR